MTKPNPRRLAAHLTILCLATTPVAALAWSDATHVYLAKHTDKAAGQVSPDELCNRLYGAVAVDMFAYDFTVVGQTLHTVVHDYGAAIPAAPYAFARTDLERAFAFGLASHNNAWGTDATAHADAVTMGNDDGYVNAKAKVLASILKGTEVYELVGKNDETLQLVSHILVEYAIDLVVARTDPAVGADLFNAGYVCPAVGSDLLVKGWAPIFRQNVDPGVDVEDVIRKADAAYHQWVAAYGMALQQPNAQELVAGAVAKVAIDFLRLPPEYLPMLAQRIDGALGVGQQLVASDLQGELDATIGRVNGQMSALKIVP